MRTSLKPIPFVFWMTLCLPSVLSLSGCSSSADDELTRYINQVKAKSARPIPPIPEFPPLKAFQYPDPDERRSPFHLTELKQQENENLNAPNMKRPKQALESYPLDALKFVGTLKQENQIWALISTPIGTISRVMVGEYMGKNFGKVIKVTDKALEIEETVQVEGKWEKKMTTFNLKTPD
jgi:type IV pilus assembly protein PilP